MIPTIPVPGIRPALLRMAWLSWGTLLLLALVHGWMLHHSHQLPLLPMLLRLLPLLLIAPVLRTRRARGYLWLTFIGILGAAQGLVLSRLFSWWWLAGPEILAGLWLTVTALLIVRQLHRQDLDGIFRER
ncbi:hypothetical protein C7446_1148 [Kushneria sinocarnis]|uniref:Uncharacterized protein n=1 Tax=Kushneria sinocarnis TaxID=595502 RepID=A0A420WYI8_9GAMM|nr:hypothetical protein [Kushneria sinocarnis]RKR06211.1 hypothetical protein C7446_1148 [Kushneria sinocarnis]